jgi:hypothetical protein
MPNTIHPAPQNNTGFILLNSTYSATTNKMLASASQNNTATNGFFIPPNSAYHLAMNIMPAPQNNTTTATNGFIPPNSAYSEFNAATNMIPTDPASAPHDNTQPYSADSVLSTATNMIPTGGWQGDKSKKCKTYEKQNANHILPEGSQCACKGRCNKGAKDENPTGLKKWKAKGKGSRGKK